jgi:hypothetical protein
MDQTVPKPLRSKFPTFLMSWKFFRNNDLPSKGCCAIDQLFQMRSVFKVDGHVKSRKILFPVIPAKA